MELDKDSAIRSVEDGKAKDYEAAEFKAHVGKARLGARLKRGMDGTCGS